MGEPAIADTGPLPQPDQIVWREYDATRINRILNDPAVRPQVADVAEGHLDISSAVANPHNVLLMGEHGGCMFLKTQPGCYEVHTACLKSGRGSWIFRFTRAAASMMFTTTDAFEITTRIPVPHRGARMLAVKTGMRFEFSRFDHCLFMGENTAVDIYSFRIQDWIVKAEGLEEVGELFHVKLLDAVRASGNTDAPHGEDRNHDKYLGAALLMIRAGQAEKATSWYNRWSLAARHQPIQLLQVSPPTIRFDAGTLVFLGDDIKVIAP